MKKWVLKVLFVILVPLLLALTIRGNVGDPLFYQKENDTRVGGPFESTGSTSRYALTQAIVENGTVFLNLDQAHFSSPDLVEKDGKFLTIFTPGVSFIGVPFYWIGKYFNMPQLFAYLSVTFFAILNFVLVSRLAYKMGAGYWASILSGFIFTFATNALGYSQTFTQHHMVTSVVLLGILNAIQKRTVLNNITFGALVGIGALLDIPNVIFMLPMGFYILAQHITKSTIKERLSISLQTKIFTILLGLAPFVILFGWYNHKTTGSYTLLAQSVGRTDVFKIEDPNKKKEVKVETPNKETASGIDLPFDTRVQLQGFYILLFSNERAWMFYSPIILLGIYGLILLVKNKIVSNLGVLCISVVVLNVLLYSMFGDPWGGWSFGPRYLIPSAAVLAAAMSLAVRKYRKNYIFLLFLILFMVYSVFVSSLGAFTTNSIPPKGEAKNLPNPIPYTYKYNFKLAETNNSSSLIYNLYLSGNISSLGFIYIFSGCVSVLLICNLILIRFTKESKNEH